MNVSIFEHLLKQIIYERSFYYPYNFSKSSSIDIMRSENRPRIKTNLHSQMTFDFWRLSIWYIILNPNSRYLRSFVLFLPVSASFVRYLLMNSLIDMLLRIRCSIILGKWRKKSGCHWLRVQFIFFFYSMATWRRSKVILDSRTYTANTLSGNSKFLNTQATNKNHLCGIDSRRRFRIEILNY